MSRSGYSDDLDPWEVICWRGAVSSAIRGRRGQAFLREMLDALDALPEKRLIVGHLVAEIGCCAIGAVAVARGLDVSDLDPDWPKAIAKRFGIARAMTQEIEYVNDGHDGWISETPEQRFVRVRRWVVGQINFEPERRVGPGGLQ